MEQAFVYVKEVFASGVPGFKSRGTFYRDKQDERDGQDDSSLGLTGDGLNPAPAHLMVSECPG